MVTVQSVAVIEDALEGKFHWRYSIKFHSGSCFCPNNFKVSERLVCLLRPLFLPTCTNEPKSLVCQCWLPSAIYRAKWASPDGMMYYHTIVEFSVSAISRKWLLWLVQHFHSSSECSWVSSWVERQHGFHPIRGRPGVQVSQPRPPETNHDQTWKKEVQVVAKTRFTNNWK